MRKTSGYAYVLFGTLISSSDLGCRQQQHKSTSKPTLTGEGTVSADMPLSTPKAIRVAQAPLRRRHGRVVRTPVRFSPIARTDYYAYTAAPLNLANAPSLHLLTPAEQTLCSQLRILPKPYLVIKETLVREYARRGGKLRRREARELVKIDVNKTSRVWDFLVQAGYLRIPDTGVAAAAPAGDNPCVSRPWCCARRRLSSFAVGRPRLHRLQALSAHHQPKSRLGHCRPDRHHHLHLHWLVLRLWSTDQPYLTLRHPPRRSRCLDFCSHQCCSRISVFSVFRCCLLYLHCPT
jgi:hypothetical protein